MPTPPPNLVPNRHCGECTLCCQHLMVDTAELQSLPGVLCAFCAENKGCTIYTTRPPICHTYFCGWRLSDVFDDSWRPDRSGVLITMTDQNIPATYMQEGLEMLLVHPEVALVKPDFFEFLFMAITRRVPVFIHLPGPIGSISAGMLINPSLEEAVAKPDNVLFMQIFNDMLKRIEKGPFQKAVFSYGHS